MAVKLDEVRKVALALPDTMEEPHHNFGSFRVRGKISVTIPPGGELLHIFLPENERELALPMDPEFLEPVHWGSKVLGGRAKLLLARKATVLNLVRRAYAFKSAHKASTTSLRSKPTQPARRPRVRPNPSLERTSTGVALGPRGARCHHAPRGPSATPAGSAQLKR